MLGILIVDKPLGISSHDVVNSVRRKLGTKRVGHAGTLDPLASGVLVVAVGPATRFLQYLPLEPKIYEGEIQFGIETTTQDAEGEVVREAPLPQDLASALDAVLPSFLGTIEQLPPMFSAVKRDGQPLYKLARQGQEIERTPRRVHIVEFQLGVPAYGVVPFRVVCSGGTYVRTLAHDLGQAVGCGAHLKSLVRTGVGKYRLADAVPLDAVSASGLIPLNEALPPMPILTLDEAQVLRIRMGQAIPWPESPPESNVAVADPAGNVIGIARVSPPFLQPEVVIPVEATYGAV